MTTSSSNAHCTAYSWYVHRRRTHRHGHTQMRLMSARTAAPTSDQGKA